MLMANSSNTLFSAGRIAAPRGPLLLGCLLVCAAALAVRLARAEDTNAYPRISEEAFKARLPFFDYDKSIKGSIKVK